MQTLEQLQSGELIGSTSLKLSCGLKLFPQEIFELADTLEILDLSGNQLSQLPDDFARLHKLKIVFFSDNPFTEFPAVLAQCKELEMIGFKANKISYIPEFSFPPKLRWLILTNNQITQLPASIGTCIHLQKVMLAGNQLNQLPDEMALCRNIELLRISANAFTYIPDWVLKLPRLSWLAINGNPFSKYTNQNYPLTGISWNNLRTAEQLGEGASGIITKAYWQADEEKPVAIKVFKGEVTSDGLPEDEMHVCLSADLHPNLVKILGQITDHPDGKQGLVLDLIPPTFRNLGGPPSFKTCTRDVFADNTSFSITDIIRISSGIASAMDHLHSKGITHGDLYAHNILINEQADALLGDFGAASLYDIQSDHAAFIERIEVRALGCLLEDLLDRVETNDRNHALIENLTRVKDTCMQEEILSRPTFGEIVEVLSVKL